MIDANGIIRIDTSTTPPKGVEIRDLQVSLGRGTGDVGQLCGDVERYIDHYSNEGQSGYDANDPTTWGDPVYAYRRANKINEWAKNKPVRSNILDVLTEAQIKAVNRGLRIPAIASLANLIGYINSEEGGTIPTQFSPASNGDTDPNFYKYIKYGWWYCSPRGKGNGSQGADEHFRIRDFENYDKSTGQLFRVDIPRITVDGGDFYIDLITDLDLTAPDYALLDTLANNNGLMFLVAVLKVGDTASNAKFKSAPTTLYGSTLYSVVQFTSAEVGDTGTITNSKVFYGGADDYNVYGFLVSRSLLNGGTTPIQNLDSTASGYKALNTMTSCIALPCEMQVVSAVATQIPNPLQYITFTLASGGSIIYNKNNMRLTVTFPQLTAVNSASQFLLTKSNLYVSVFLQKISDTSHTWESGLLPMGLTGTVTIGSTSVEVFPASTSKVITDSSLQAFIGDDVITDYNRSALIYYKDSYDIYRDVATLAL